jgi:hypothetical protein
MRLAKSNFDLVTVFQTLFSLFGGGMPKISTG